MMNKRSFHLSCLAAMIFCSSAVMAQTKSQPTLRVEGEVLKPLTLSVDDLRKMKQTEVNATDRDGKEHVYQGVQLVEVLSAAGVTLGAQLRGENLVKYLLAKAVDGYEVIYSLPEVDPEFTGQIVLLAYQVDGSPLPKGEGPFRMVVPNDKKHARWIREIASIKVVFSKE